MNCNAALVVLLAVVSVCQAGMDEEKVKELLMKCKEETGATEDVYHRMKTWDVPTTHEGKCMFACVLQNTGAMKDDRLDADVVSSLVEAHYKDKAKIEEAVKVVAKCALIDVKGLDKCEAAAAYGKCSKDNGLEI